MELTLQQHTIQVNILEIKGRLDAASVPGLREAQTRLLEAGERHFVVDLSQATFMDSAGMSALVSLLKRARQAGGDVILVKPEDPEAHRILSLTRFD